MTLLITPNGFPLECTRDEYEVTVEKVNRVIAAIEPSDEINFSVQLDLLTVFTEALGSVKGFFTPLVNNPTMSQSTTVVSFLCALADDVNRASSKTSYKGAARTITLWSSLFSLEMPDTSLVPPSKQSMSVLQQASTVQAADVVHMLSKTRPISELVDIMKILFGDHGHV